MDWMDIIAGTVTSKWGGAGKVVNSVIAGSTDYTIGDKLKTTINGTKNGFKAVVDGGFEAFKALMGEMGDMGGVSKIRQEATEVVSDQVQTTVGDIIE